jgi:hypothetical protein
MRDSHSAGNGVSSLLECYIMSTGEQLLVFAKIVASSFSEWSSPKRVYLDYLTLKMKALRTFETSVSVYQSTRHNISEYLKLLLRLFMLGRPLTAEARVRCRIGPCGICGGQSDTGTGFFPRVLRFSPVNFISTAASLKWNGRKNLIIFLIGLHNKPSRLLCVRSICCGALQ